MAVLETIETVLDAFEAEEAKKKGIAKAAKGVPEEWVDEAMEVIKKLAASNKEFTSDDVWATGLAKPKEPRALGVVFTKASRAGFIEPTGKWVLTAQVLRHAAPIRVWRGK